MQNKNYDVIIIGVGPAGLSAAIYTGRARMSTLVFGIVENSHLYKAHTISNYFGFEKDISGPFIMEQGIKQAERFDTRIIPREITSIIINADGTFTITDCEKEVYAAKNLILCTGTSYAISGIKNEEKLIGKGISHCVTCDGFFFRDKKIAVIGHGNYAAEEAMSLLTYSKDVTILSHGKEFFFSDSMRNHLSDSPVILKKTPKIKEFWSDPTKVGSEKFEKILYEDGTVDEGYAGVFMAIGTAGAISFAQKLGLILNGNYIVVNDKGETNIPNIYAAGNCTGADPQAAISVGQGCAAAMAIIKKNRGVKVYVQYN
ncbi:NAD(P)/FAD-dependent oxidoreductase [Candidatus Peregrinibacteria bacterium]|nr:NAD(P)/FAD-dependent oxidoreductase [Candidatus Peregrinibacteria bacterium]